MPSSLSWLARFSSSPCSASAPSLAQEAATPAVDPSPWAQLLVDLRPALVNFVMAVLIAAGGVVTWYARKLGGEQAAVIANQGYQILIDQAAGWLLGERKEGRAPTVDDAVDYLRTSYPEVDKIEPSNAKLGNDIIGALRRLAKG